MLEEFCLSNPVDSYIGLQIKGSNNEFNFSYLKHEDGSGRVLDFRFRGHWFETQQRHRVVSLSNILYPLLSTGSTQEMSRHGLKIVDWDIKHQLKQKSFPKQLICCWILKRTISMREFL